MNGTSFNIVKRDGKHEPFSMDKITAAIEKAFRSVGQTPTAETLGKLTSCLYIHEGTSVEEIQNQVELTLMSHGYYGVAKSFIIYRQQHFEDREVRDKLAFLVDYCNAENPATGSKYDANANVENKNIATLIGELPKRNFIRLNRRLLCDRIKELYGREMADSYIELLDRHFIYKNDETSMANYCASITMYPWLVGGTISIGGNSTSPTNLKSFCGGFVNMVFIVGSMLSGACATPEFLDVPELLHRAGVRPGLLPRSGSRRRPVAQAPYATTKSSPIASSRSSTRSTSRPARGTSKPFSGTSPTTTATISRACSATFSSPTDRGPTGIRSTGCSAASCAGSTTSGPRRCSPFPSRRWPCCPKTAT